MALHERQCIARRLHSAPVEVVVHNARDDTPHPAWLDGADAVIIGGSGSFGVADAPGPGWLGGFRALLDRALADDIPGFAICFGHQLLGLHLGSEVLTDERRAEAGTVTLSLTREGARDSLFSVLPRQFSAQTGHSDHVSQVPRGVRLLAHNATLEAQAFRVDGTRFYSTQFHPDLSAAEARERYLAYYGSQLPAEVQSTLRRFRAGPDDGQVLLSRFVDHVAAPYRWDAAEVLDLGHPKGPSAPPAASAR